MLNRNLGRGVRPTQRNPHPVQDTKDEILLSCLRASAVISYPVQEWTKAGRIQNTKNGIYVGIFMHSNEGARNQRKLCDRRGRKGEDLHRRPCLRHENVQLYTLFKTEDPQNDTLTVGTSLYMKYMAVPPPPPPPRGLSILV